MSFQFENPDGPPTTTAARVPVSNADIFAAHNEASQYDAISFGRRNAQVDATGNRINAIKDATGQDVENPYNGGYMDQAMAAYANENPRFRSSPLDPSTNTMPSPYRELTAEDMPRINELQMQAFQNRLNELHAKFPDKADAIGAKRPISEDAIELANSAQRKADALSSATTGLVPATAAFLGGMVGSFRDPIQAGALFVGGPEIKAVSTLGKVASAGIQQAIVNAGIAAASQPSVQQWRAERGQESGVIPALKDVGLNALFGLIPGAGIEAGKVGWIKFVSPRLARLAADGDESAAREVSAALPKDVAPEIHAAVEGERLDAAAKSEPPPNDIPNHVAEPIYNQAVRRGEDIAEPLPEIAHIPAAEPHRALDAIKDARTPIQAFDALREDPAAIPTALGSNDPHLSMAGKVASLGDEAYALVKSGEAHPTIAAEVAARIVDPAEQANILKEVIDQKPASAHEAAQLVSQAMDRNSLAEAMHAMLGANEPLEREFLPLETVTEEPQPYIRGSLPRRQTGIRDAAQFARDFGGTMDEGKHLRTAELQKTFKGIYNPNGRSIDKLREAMAEQGYFPQYGSAEEAMIHSTADDVVNAIENKTYSTHDEAAVAEHEAYLDRKTKIEGHVSDMTATAKAAGEKPPKATLNRAAEIMVDEGMSADDAFHAALMETTFQNQKMRHLFGTGEHAIDWSNFESVAEPTPSIERIAELGGQTREAWEREFEPSGKAAVLRTGERVPNAGENARPEKFEPGAEGKPQQLIPGVAPVTDRQRAELAASKPLRGVNLAAGGLFDENARAQGDMFSRVLQAPEKETELGQRIANLEQGLKDKAPIVDEKWRSAAAERDRLIAEEPRAGFLSQVVAGCPEE
jgi:hypothetical protein